jgi:hypothetical protein
MPFSGNWTIMTYEAWFYLRLTVGQNFSLGGGQCEGTTTPSGVKLYMSSGNIASGTVQLYGLKK